MSYSDLLKDPRWQKVRLEVLERDGWECGGCGKKTKTLHVHHWWYEKGKKPWEYPPETLSTLCEDCHKDVTDHKLAMDKWLARIGWGEWDRVIGYIQGLLFLDGQAEKIIAPNRGYVEGLADAWRLSEEEIIAEIDNHRIGLNELRRILRRRQIYSSDGEHRRGALHLCFDVNHEDGAEE